MEFLGDLLDVVIDPHTDFTLLLLQLFTQNGS
jgi:hypothetical protein